MSHGWFLNAATARYPAVVLGAEAASLLAKGAYNGLFLGLGAGVANIMVISVLERRSEIGPRRALGASRRHVAEQFLAEAVLCESWAAWPAPSSACWPPPSTPSPSTGRC